MTLSTLPHTVPSSVIPSDHLRLEPVVGDAMAPTLSCRDFVLCMPTTEFQGDGVYLIEMHGAKVLQRATMLCDGTGSIRLTCDNSALVSAWTVSREKFDAVVLAIVVADVIVRNENLMHRRAGR